MDQGVGRSLETSKLLIACLWERLPHAVHLHRLRVVETL